MTTFGADRRFRVRSRLGRRAFCVPADERFCARTNEDFDVVDLGARSGPDVALHLTINLAQPRPLGSDNRVVEMRRRR
jgi:hypothetical protein